MAKLSKEGDTFVLEMNENEIRNLVGSLNSNAQGIEVQTAKRWATFLNAYKDSRILRDALRGSPARVPNQNPFE